MECCMEEEKYCNLDPCRALSIEIFQLNGKENEFSSPIFWEPLAVDAPKCEPLAMAAPPVSQQNIEMEGLGSNEHSNRVLSSINEFTSL